MSRFKHIISPKKQPLTLDEIKAYVNNTLSEEERYTIEDKMMASNLNRDALEGFIAFPEAFEAFQKAEDQFHAELPVKQGKFKFQYGVFAILGLAVVFYLVGAYFLMERDKHIEKQQKDNLLADVSDSSTIDTLILLPEVIVEELNDVEIDSAVQKPIDKQIHAQKVIAHSPIILDTLTQDSTIEEQIAKAIEIKKQEIIQPEKMDSAITNILIYTNIPTRYSSGLLIVDYSKINKRTVIKDQKIFDPILTSTSPALENKDDHLNEAQQDLVQTIEIDYLDFINETQKYFYQNKFKKALKRYKIILEQYPNDLNAHFYAGLCYYNINKPEKAIEHFDIAIITTYNTFNEESEWYKAQCLAELGRTQDLISLLNKIATQKGFYAEKADKWLGEL